YMYLGIDIGGTKTLVANFDNQGSITAQTKYPTPKKYKDFLQLIKDHAAKLKLEDFKAAGVGTAGRLDRTTGSIISWSNLGWYDKPLKTDLAKIIKLPIFLENDAKLAGLSEAVLVHKKYRKVLYVTISTGIGVSLITDGVIDQEVGDAGGRGVLLEHEGKLVDWESFGSGKALYEKYGKKASEITDAKVWKAFAKDTALGLDQFIGFTEPDVVIIGGGVGAHFEKFQSYLEEELSKISSPMVPTPPLLKAQRPEEAVIYGCYEYIKQHS
ncbi:MAG TPA: ROK family protein, partial [Candidatus Saccharimonadales bacterium]|nr:ROK family protein [Candidatus Saccharimonadales bacterium]